MCPPTNSSENECDPSVASGHARRLGGARHSDDPQVIRRYPVRCPRIRWDSSRLRLNSPRARFPRRTARSAPSPCGRSNGSDRHGRRSTRIFSGSNSISRIEVVSQFGRTTSVPRTYSSRSRNYQHGHSDVERYFTWYRTRLHGTRDGTSVRRADDAFDGGSSSRLPEARRVDDRCRRGHWPGVRAARPNQLRSSTATAGHRAESPRRRHGT
jgi:hypothetical protein